MTHFIERVAITEAMVLAAGGAPDGGWLIRRPETSTKARRPGPRVLAALKRYLRVECAAGNADVDDPDMASAQLLGMIVRVILWPRLVHGNWALSQDETVRVVEAAARTMVARYASRRRRRADGQVPAEADGGNR